MSKRPVVYDITRLITRFSRPAPNGIDRVDIQYAQHFLSRERSGCGAILGPLGVRAVDNVAAGRVVGAISDHWRENGTIKDDLAYQRLAARLSAPPALSYPNAQSTRAGLSQFASTVGGALRVLPAFGRSGLIPARGLRQTVAQDAIYLNTSQFPLWIDGYFRWLDQRPDVKAVFFIHDLLPLEYPEFFPPAEAQRHAKRIDVLARRAAGIIVAGEVTQAALIARFKLLGHVVPPIAVIPLPVSPQFLVAGPRLPVSSDRGYFVAVGTIEPRKNQLLLLNIWRELVERFGESTPRLLLIGMRGWDNENIVDMLERCDRIRPFVIEAAGLSTPAMVRIMSGARAVLIPTFAEGYGLPFAEAAALRLPVIASHIAAFDGRAEHVKMIDALDGPGWRDAIIERMAAMPPENRAGIACPANAATTQEVHFRNCERFIGTL